MHLYCFASLELEIFFIPQQLKFLLITFVKHDHYYYSICFTISIFLETYTQTKEHKILTFFTLSIFFCLLNAIKDRGDIWRILGKNNLWYMKEMKDNWRIKSMRWKIKDIRRGSIGKKWGKIVRNKIWTLKRDLCEMEGVLVFDLLSIVWIKDFSSIVFWLMENIINLSDYWFFLYGDMVP